MTKKKKILVVEDEEPLRYAITKKLETYGLEPIGANSVDSALQQLKNNGPIAAVWLDHYLIGTKDGLDFVVSMRSNKEFAKIPVYVVSNTATDAKVSTYIKLGVEKYYVKSDHRLDEIIGDILDNIEKESHD
ncbi:MAG TPA: response regulator [Candidatus Acidoferrum sp.]|nr:response regulator [Candidatus Acidoferrum sp.]